MTDIQTLRDIPRPAWLWDPALRRVVWANPAALAFFGEESLLDLVERPFDAREPAVEAIARALEAASGGAETALDFPSVSEAPLRARVRRHALADGRPGALVEALEPLEPERAGHPGLLREVLDAMPIPVAAADERAGLVYANPAALELFEEAALGGLAAFFARREEARAFLERAARAGMASRMLEGRTRLGPRDIRLTARLTERDADGSAALFTILMEDITARRRVSRALERAAEWPRPPAGEPPEKSEEPSETSGEDAAGKASGTRRREEEEAKGKAGERRAPETPRKTRRRPGLPLSSEDISAFRRLSQAAAPEKDAAPAGGENPPARPRRPRAPCSGEPAGGARPSASEKPASGASARDAGEDESPRTPEIPALVRDVLDHRPDLIILHRDAAFYYANAAARAHFAAPDGDGFWPRLAARLAAAEDGADIAIAPPGGRERLFRLKRDAFPWRDGALLQSTLRPLEAPAEEKAPAGAEQPETAGAGAAAGKDTSSAREASRKEGARELPAGEEERSESPAGEARDAAKSQPLVRIVSSRPAEEKPREETELGADPHNAPVAEHDAPAAEDSAPPAPREAALEPSAGAPAGAEAPRAAEGAAMDEELRVILDTATDGIITLNRRGRILSFSAGAQALFGLSLSEAVGRSFKELIAPESRELVEDYLSALASGASLSSIYNEGREVSARVAGGGRIPLFLTIGRMGRKGEPERDNKAAFCVVVRDITQWKETEKDLRMAKERAERSSAQKSEFLASISHELRTPLNAILGFSDVMRQQRFGEMGNEKYLGYANDIHESGEHLLSLINDLLDLSKIEAGKFELNFEAVDLAAVADDCLNIMQEQAARAHVILRRSIPDDLPKVVADARSMKQILLNLLSNAVKFTGSGGQVMTSLRLEKSGELSLSVSDTGPGMSEEELERALKPFERITGQGRPDAPGTGLGLPLTRALAEANHARFSISSQPGEGTTATIVFPTPRVLAG